MDDRFRHRCHADWFAKENDVFLVAYDEFHTSINVMRGCGMIEYEIDGDAKNAVLRGHCKVVKHKYAPLRSFASLLLKLFDSPT
jgi:hypothetical protein